MYYDVSDRLISFVHLQRRIAEFRAPETCSLLGLGCLLCVFSALLRHRGLGSGGAAAAGYLSVAAGRMAIGQTLAEHGDAACDCGKGSVFCDCVHSGRDDAVGAGERQGDMDAAADARGVSALAADHAGILFIGLLSVRQRGAVSFIAGLCAFDQLQSG